MKVLKYFTIILILLVFVFSLPKFSVSAGSGNFIWEQCAPTLSCQTRTIGATTWQCHRDVNTGQWQWNPRSPNDAQSLVNNGGPSLPDVQSEIESNRNSFWPPICSDGSNNNCLPTGTFDSNNPSLPQGTFDSNNPTCSPPWSSIVSVDGNGVPYFDRTNDGQTAVRVSVVGENTANILQDSIDCRWYSSAQGYDSTTGTQCVSTSNPFYKECDFNSGVTSNGALEGSHTGYVACAYVNKDTGQTYQGQIYTDGISDRTVKKVQWTGDWTGPKIIFNSPSNPTGVPYIISIDLSDLYAGVAKNTIKIFVSNPDGSNNDVTSSFSITGNCDTGGVTCTVTRTINKGDAESSDGTHTITVYANDKLGNPQQNPKIYTYTVSTCNLNSVSISQSASCNKNLNLCTSTGNSCGAGDSVSVTAVYTGLNCPTSFTIQVDAQSSDGLCNVQGSGGQITGISITCSNPIPSGSPQTCNGVWKLPNPIPPVCQQKLISAINDGTPNDQHGCINSQYCTTPTGSFGVCLDPTKPYTAITLNGGQTMTKSATITATSLTGHDNTYGLNSCTLDWGDESPTNTKSCAGSIGEDCGGLFSATDKQYTYSSGGLKTATFSCTNKNSVTGSSSTPITICTSIGSVTGLQAYDSSLKNRALTSAVWQNINAPYFAWNPVTSLCGVNYLIQEDGKPQTSQSINSYSTSLTDGQHQIKFNSRDNVGNTGSQQTFSMWVDTVPPTTSVTESIPVWISTPTTFHLTCTDAASGCASTQYCLGGGCTPNTNYNPVTGILVSSSTIISYRSTDVAGNVETTKSSLVNFDNTPPTTPVVTDNGPYTTSTTQLSATWTQSTDPESGVVGYQYSVGTTPGGTDILSYTSSGLSQTATITGLSLTEGKKYYINARAINGAGLFSSPGTSNGVIVHALPPTGMDNLIVQKAYGKYISSPFTISTDPSIPVSDLAGIDTTSCSYSIDGSTWESRPDKVSWDASNKGCKTTPIICDSDGQQYTIQMRVSNILGTSAQTVVPLARVCDKNSPQIQSIQPETGETRRTSSKNPSFSLTAMDSESGMARVEWNLYVNGILKNTLITTCDGGEKVSVTCPMQTSSLINTATLNDKDVVLVKVRADDHIDPWSPYQNSGQWVIDQDSPGISTITPTVATLGVSQSYSANVIAQNGKTISSCDLLVNGVKVGDMSLTSGNNKDGAWTGPYTINSPATLFMRGHCTDNLGNIGDGVDTQISLATNTGTSVSPLVADKSQIINITASYNTINGGAITGANCWVSSTTFNDPSYGILGASLQDLQNGYYTYSFPAPKISGSYNYAISCAKTGYQTTTASSSFNVLGCNGQVCIQVMPASTNAVLTLGEPQSINLLIKNRDDFSRTYSVSLPSPDPKISAQVSPMQITLGNGQEQVVKIQLTSLVISDQLIVQNVLVKNTDPSKSADSATAAINIAIAVSAVPELGAIEILTLFAIAAIIIYQKAGIKNKKTR